MRATTPPPPDWPRIRKTLRTDILWAYGKTLKRHGWDADDIVQDALVNLLRFDPPYSRTVQKLVARWAFLRRWQRRIEVGGDPDQLAAPVVDPNEAMDKQAMLTAFFAHLASLRFRRGDPDECVAVAKAHLLDGYRWVEIPALMGVEDRRVNTYSIRIRKEAGYCGRVDHRAG